MKEKIRINFDGVIKVFIADVLYKQWNVRINQVVERLCFYDGYNRWKEKF